MTTTLSKAATREREIVTDMEQAIAIISRASGKMRADSFGAVVVGMLGAAVLILESVSADVDRRTSD